MHHRFVYECTMFDKENTWTGAGQSKEVICLEYNEMMAVKHWVIPINACVVAAHPLLQSPGLQFLLSLTNEVEVHMALKLITAHCDWEKYFEQLYEYQEYFVATEGQNITLNAAASEGISFYQI